MAYKLFKPEIGFGKGKATISIRKNSINFSRKVSRQYLNGISYVELYFDEDNKKIGIKPLSEKTDTCYAVKGEKGKWMRAKDFLQFYHCSTGQAKRYEAQWNEETKLLEIKL